MEENIITNEIVEQVEEKVLDKAAETAITPVQPTATPANNTTDILKDVGFTVLGIGAGIAIDKWVVPAFRKGISALKNKRAERKAAKQAKKAAKEKKNAPPQPAPESKVEDGIDPNTIKAEID